MYISQVIITSKLDQGKLIKEWLTLRIKLIQMSAGLTHKSAYILH